MVEREANMRFYGKRSGRNNIPRLIVRSYKYYGRQQSNTRSNITNKNGNISNNIKTNNRYSMDQEAIFKTKMIQDKYHLYNGLTEWEIAHQRQFSFDSLIKKYVKKIFQYESCYPEKDTPELYNVPKECWLERIFKSKKQHRLEVIEKNKAIIEEVNQKYLKAIAEYEENKKMAYENWIKQETEEKRMIDENNKRIENWEQKYYCGDTEGVNQWIQYVIDSIKPVGDIKFLITNRFIEQGRNLYLKVAINSLYEIFAFSEYKYLPRKREIRAIEMKVRDRIAHSRKLIENILYSFIYIFYYNDIGNVINKLTIDVVSDELVLGSCWCTRENAKCVKNKKSVIIDSSQIRICKNIQKEVESFAYEKMSN